MFSKGTFSKIIAVLFFLLTLTAVVNGAPPGKDSNSKDDSYNTHNYLRTVTERPPPITAKRYNEESELVSFSHDNSPKKTQSTAYSYGYKEQKDTSTFGKLFECCK